MIDTQELKRAIASGFRPLPGRCLVEFDTPPSKTSSGLLHIPDSAQEKRLLTHSRGSTVYGDSTWLGTVLAISPRRNPKTGLVQEEEVSSGDRVLVALLQEEMSQSIVVTRIERLWAKATF